MRGMGRPSSFKPEYCDLVLQLGAEGKSKAQMCAAIGISRDTLYRWVKEFPDFSDAISRATELSQSWWENVAQTQGLTREFNAATWGKSMSARFPNDYSDRSKVELTGRDGGPVQLEDGQAAARIAAILNAAQQRRDADIA